MSAWGRRDATPLPPAFLHKEADSVYHVRSWLNEIGIPDAHIRAEEQPAGGAIRPTDRMDLYILDKRVIIEVKRQGRLTRGPYERGTGSGRCESAHEQVGRYVAGERGQGRIYSDGGMGEREWIGAVTDGRVWWVWLWPAGLLSGAEPEECVGWAGTVLSRYNAEELARIIRRECSPATRRIAWNKEAAEGGGQAGLGRGAPPAARAAGSIGAPRSKVVKGTPHNPFGGIVRAKAASRGSYETPGGLAASPARPAAGSCTRVVQMRLGTWNEGAGDGRGGYGRRKGGGGGVEAPRFEWVARDGWGEWGWDERTVSAVAGSTVRVNRSCAYLEEFKRGRKRAEAELIDAKFGLCVYVASVALHRSIGDGEEYERVHDRAMAAVAMTCLSSSYGTSDEDLAGIVRAGAAQAGAAGDARGVGHQRQRHLSTGVLPVQQFKSAHC